MNQPFDVFRNDKDGLMWRETATSLDEAKATVERLSKCESGDFIILNQETQEQTTIKAVLTKTIAA